MEQLWLVRLYEPPHSTQRKGYLNDFAVVAPNAERAVEVLRRDNPSAFSLAPTVYTVLPIGSYVSCGASRTEKLPA